MFQGFQNYTPDTDLDNVRNRVVGILLGLFVTAVVFQYIWPERAIDRLRDTLRQALHQLARLLMIPTPDTPPPEARSKADGLVAEISRELAQAGRHAEQTSFELDEPQCGDRASLAKLETTLSHANHVLSLARSLNSDSAWTEWQQLPPDAKTAESELRNVVAKRIDLVAHIGAPNEAGTELSAALAHWNEAVRPMHRENSRVELVSQLVAEVQKLK